MDKGHWTSCRWPVQCRGEALKHKQRLWDTVSIQTGRKIWLRKPEKERGSDTWITAHTAKKLGQRKTENQHSLKPQHANISPWQWVERVGNTKEVVGRWKKSCYRMIPVHLNMLPWCCCQQTGNKKQDMMCSLHVCSPRVRWLTEMRKKTMQLREKPLV